MQENDAAVHVLVVTMGSAGDLFPFLRLALGLQQPGRRVTLLAPVMHEPYVRRAGVDFHPLSADPAVLADPDLWDARRGFGVVWRALRPGMRDLRQYVEALPPGEPCLMVAHPLVLPEAAACRALRPDMRLVGAYLAPSNIRTVYDPLMLGPLAIPRWVPRAVRRWLWDRIGASLIDPVALPDINQARAELGLPPSTSFLGAMHAAPELSVTLFPDWFGPPKPDWPQPLCMGDFTLYDPTLDDPQSKAALPETVLTFLEAGTAPLVFTHGTGNQQAERYFELALAAAATLERRVILLTPHRAQLPRDLPPSALWVDYVPLRILLPHVAALIHHGGIGTTAEALRAGIPQLIVALAYDQFDNGARVHRLGAGLTLNAARMSRRRLVKSLTALINSNEIKDACSAVKASFGTATVLASVFTCISKLISRTGKN